MTDRQARDLPLDAHLHTTLSPDSNVPIDTYAAAALERGIAEIAITDHVDFEPGAPAFALHDVRGSRTDRPRRRGALGAAGRPHPLRRRADLRPLVGAGHPRPPGPPCLRLHDRLGPRPGGLANTIRDAWRPGSRAVRCREIVAPSFDEVAAAARSGLFDAIGHIDGVKRYLYPHVTPGRPRGRARAVRADPRARSSTAARRSRSTRAACATPIGESFPHAGHRGPLP